MSGQTRRASSQLASWSFAPSPPMNVLTYGTPIASAAVMTCLRWPMTSARCAGIGMEGVRVVAESGDGEALRRDLVDDLGRLAGGQGGDVDVARSRRTGGSSRSCVASTRSRGSRSRRRRTSRRRPSTASRGTGRSAGRVSWRRCLRAGAADRDRIAHDVDPPADPGALGDGVVDQHLVVAVGEGRVAGRAEGPPAATSA